MKSMQVSGYFNQSDVMELDSVSMEFGISRSKLVTKIVLEYLMRRNKTGSVEDQLVELRRRIEKLEQSQK